MRTSAGRAAAVVVGVEPPRPLDRAGAEHAARRWRAGRASCCASRCRCRSPSRSRQHRRGVVGRRGEPDRARPGGSRCRGPRPTRSPACPGGSVAVWPAASVATDVLRQKRILPSAAGTSIAPVAPSLTMKSVPVSAFSGLPPSAGGLKRGSRQVPVHVAAAGRSWRWRASPCSDQRAVGVPEPSMLFSQRVFQKTSLPLKKARLTPASRAASTLARCAPDQYSSWPTDRNALCSSSSAPRAVGVDAGRVADVVAVALEPADHRVLGVEDPVLAVRSRAW